MAPSLFERTYCMVHGGTLYRCYTPNLSSRPPLQAWLGDFSPWPPSPSLLTPSRLLKQPSPGPSRALAQADKCQPACFNTVVRLMAGHMNADVHQSGLWAPKLRLGRLKPELGDSKPRAGAHKPTLKAPPNPCLLTPSLGLGTPGPGP